MVVIFENGPFPALLSFFPFILVCPANASAFLYTALPAYFFQGYSKTNP
jgi:hypothetical protein